MNTEFPKYLLEHTVDAWTVPGLGCWPSSTSHTWVSFLVIPPCSSFLHFLRFNQFQPIRTVAFTTEKNPSTSGLVQFKPVLFKDQLYIKSLEKKVWTGNSVKILKSSILNLSCLVQSYISFTKLVGKCFLFQYFLEKFVQCWVGLVELNWCFLYKDIIN